MEPKTIPTEIGLFFDTETTGIPNWKVPSNRKEQPHMTQLAAVLMDIPNREVIHSMNVIIQPDGWEIPPECVDLNGITTEFATDVGIPEGLALDMFLEIWVGEGHGHKRYAFNTTFDNRIIRIATKRYSKQYVDLWKEGDYECMMIKAKKHLGLGKNPKLVEAYREICGKELVGAHDAMNDINATIELFYAMRDAGDDADTIDVFG